MEISNTTFISQKNNSIDSCVTPNSNHELSSKKKHIQISDNRENSNKKTEKMPNNCK